MKENPKDPKEIRNFLKKLPPERRIYYQFGPLFVEVTKEEALKLLEEASSSENKLQKLQKKEVQNEKSGFSSHG